MKLLEKLNACVVVLIPDWLPLLWQLQLQDRGCSQWGFESWGCSLVCWSSTLPPPRLPLARSCNSLSKDEMNFWSRPGCPWRILHSKTTHEVDQIRVYLIGVLAAAGIWDPTPELSKVLVRGNHIHGWTSPLDTWVICSISCAVKVFILAPFFVSVCTNSAAFKVML